jgi:hypothetical protein
MRAARAARQQKKQQADRTARVAWLRNPLSRRSRQENKSRLDARGDAEHAGKGFSRV